MEGAGDGTSEGDILGSQEGVVDVLVGSLVPIMVSIENLDMSPLGLLARM